MYWMQCSNRDEAKPKLDFVQYVHTHTSMVYSITIAFMVIVIVDDLSSLIPCDHRDDFM
jgi:hypothetical protein